MKSTRAVLPLFLATAAFAQTPAPSQGGVSPQATAPTAASSQFLAGWRSLATTDAWRGYKQPTFPAKGWSLADGVLTHAANGGGGDLITTDQYADLDLSFEFRTASKSNSGVMFGVAETLDTTWQTGPEYQVLDDAGHNLKPNDPHSSGSLYDMLPPADGKTLHPAGEWNQGRIRLRNGVLEHWLNGTRLVETRVYEDDPTGVRTAKPTKSWLELIAKSKFKDYKGFGLQPRGHLALQDHGDEIAYRNIRARDLSQPIPGEFSLFNGRDLAGWRAFSPDAEKNGTKAEDSWSVREGVLVCSGAPNGYIRSKETYDNYVLFVQWRFSPVTKKAGNSGVLLSTTGPDKLWPSSIEAQLMSEYAGDFWNIGEFQMTTHPARTKGKNTKRATMAERPVGEWNEYEIIVNHGEIVLIVNGQEVNRATNVKHVPGNICLQSEGAEIHFRNIRLLPLK